MMTQQQRVHWERFLIKHNLGVHISCYGFRLNYESTLVGAKFPGSHAWATGWGHTADEAEMALIQAIRGKTLLLVEMVSEHETQLEVSEDL